LPLKSKTSNQNHKRLWLDHRSSASFWLDSRRNATQSGVLFKMKMKESIV